MSSLFSNQKVEVKGKIVFDFSSLKAIVNRKLIINDKELKQALLELILINKITEVKITIETL